MTRLLPLLLLLAFAGCTSAPAPLPFVPPQTVTVEPGTFATLPVPGEVTTLLALKPDDPAKLSNRMLAIEGGYAITLGGGVDEADVLLIGEGWSVRYVVRTGEKPNPPPGPEPPTPPGPEPPKPTDEPLRIVVVEESEERTTEQAAVYLDKALRDYMTSKGHSFEVWDKDATPTGEGAAERQAILDRAKGKPLPYLQVIGKTSGNVYSEGGLPKGDAAAMLKFIQGWEAAK